MTNRQPVISKLCNASNSASSCALTAQESALAEHLDAHVDRRCIRRVVGLEACERETPGLIELLHVARLITLMPDSELQRRGHTDRGKLRAELIGRVQETPQDLSESSTASN